MWNFVWRDWKYSIQIGSDSDNAALSPDEDPSEFAWIKLGPLRIRYRLDTYVKTTKTSRYRVTMNNGSKYILEEKVVSHEKETT
jgi:predicted secreted protein